MLTMTEKPAGLITSTEAARRLDLSKPTILAWFESGELRGWRHLMNRRVWIFESEIPRKLREMRERDEGRP